MEAKLLYICPIVLLSLFISYFLVLTYKLPESFFKYGIFINIGRINSFDVQKMPRAMKEALRARLVTILMLGMAVTLVVGGFAVRFGSMTDRRVGIAALALQIVAAFVTMLIMTKHTETVRKELIQMEADAQTAPEK